MQSFFKNNVKYLPCLMTESNLYPDKSHFYFQTIYFSFGGNLSKLPTVLGAWARMGGIILCSGLMITSDTKITRHLADTVNYPLRFKQSQTRVKFAYIIIAFIYLPLVYLLFRILLLFFRNEDIVVLAALNIRL